MRNTTILNSDVYTDLLFAAVVVQEHFEARAASCQETTENSQALNFREERPSEMPKKLKEMIKPSFDQKHTTGSQANGTVSLLPPQIESRDEAVLRAFRLADTDRKFREALTTRMKTVSRQTHRLGWIT